MDQYGAEQPKSSSGLKVLLWVLGVVGLLLVCVCAGGIYGVYRLASRNFTQDPVAVQQVAYGITAISLPETYPPAASFQIFGMKMAIFGEKEGQGQQPMLMLMEFPRAIAGDPEEMKKQMEQGIKQQGGQQANVDVQATEERRYSIRGEERTVVINRGTSEDGSPVVQALATFTSKDGNPAMLMLMAPGEKWDETELEVILESMH